VSAVVDLRITSFTNDPALCQTTPYWWRSRAKDRRPAVVGGGL